MALRCPGCRSRRASFSSMQAHIAASGHALCGCGAFHYPHRPGSSCCILNPLSALHDASRRHTEDDDLRRIAQAIIQDHPEATDKVMALLAHWRINP